LFDFLHRRTPWHRRLWSIGTFLGLEEVVEYSRVRREANLPPDGLKHVAASMRREIALDPGAAPVADQISKILQRAERIDGNDENALEHLAQRVDDGYLSRWATAIAADTLPPVERTARSIASHLLDKGFSSDHLYRWLDADRHRHGEPDLARVLAEAAAMSSATVIPSYEVLVPCSIPGRPTRLPAAVRWMDAAEVAREIAKLRPDEPKPRQGGAFLLKVTERDPWAAVEAANELIARVAARVQLGRPGPGVVRATGVAYVVGSDREFHLRPPRRQLDVHALHRQGAVFDVDPGDSRQLDDALELAAYLETGSAGAAITGGWAAVEGLLLHPGERGHVVAADRLANIVACSVGRAELTPLAFAHEKHGDDDLASRLRDMDATSSNYERVRLVERHLRSESALIVASASDSAALDRVRAILSNPQDELSRITHYVQDTFRRLYNQRNLVMHGGSFRSLALTATLRTAPPLVGAGLDRIVHAQLGAERSSSPLALSARAETELGLLDTPGASLIVDLLGR
jgi:hypothetical protein